MRGRAFGSSGGGAFGGGGALGGLLVLLGVAVKGGFLEVFGSVVTVNGDQGERRRVVRGASYGLKRAMRHPPPASGDPSAPWFPSLMP